MCVWLQSYVSLLLETKCLVLMGTKGSCKSSVANYLGKHLVYRMGDQDEGRIVTFNVAIDGHEVCEENWADRFLPACVFSNRK